MQEHDREQEKASLSHNALSLPVYHLFFSLASLASRKIEEIEYTAQNPSNNSNNLLLYRASMN